MTPSWNPKIYGELLKKQDRTVEEEKQLKEYRFTLHKQLCYSGRSDFTSYVHQYLNEPLDSDEFRKNFIWLSGEFINLLDDIEQHPSELSELIIDYDFKHPFFKFKTTILDASLTMAQESDSNVMSESDFRTLVARAYYDFLIGEDG